MVSRPSRGVADPAAAPGAVKGVHSVARRGQSALMNYSNFSLTLCAGVRVTLPVALMGLNGTGRVHRPGRHCLDREQAEVGLSGQGAYSS